MTSCRADIMADCVFSPIHISKNHIKHCIVETRQAI